MLDAEMSQEGAAEFDHFLITDCFLYSNRITPHSVWGKCPVDDAALANEPDWDYTTVAIHHSGDSLLDTNKTIWDIEHKHVVVQKWRAIGYHFLIDRVGNIFEGRRLPYKGTHVEGANTGKIGIVLVGDYEHQFWDIDDDIAKPQIDAAVRLINALRGIFPLTELGGHKDWKKTTECPGNVLYAELNGMRTRTGLASPGAGGGD